jgi:hypothetical protein
MLNEGHNYLFMFQKVVSKTTGNKLMIAFRSNQDKDINTKNVLVLQHVWGQGVEGKIQVDGNDMMIGESLLKIEFQDQDIPTVW